ncbi:MAG TPA: hypothetical protein VF188_16010 [Longimicrobiales bacterium]
MHRFTRTRPRVLVLSASLAALIACQGDRSGRAVTVTDSAGVRVTISRDGPRTFAEVLPDPVLSLGGADISGPAQFSNIRGVRVDSRGNLWVADGGSGEVRIFRPDGTHWKTIGGPGEGPGEFRRIRLLGAFRGDTVAFWDDSNPRLTLLGPDGGFVRTVTRSWGDEVPPLAVDVFRDGTILARAVRVFFAASLPRGQAVTDTTMLFRLDVAGGPLQPQARARGRSWAWTGRTQVPVPFTIDPGFDLDGDAVHLAAGPEFRIRVFEDGRLTEVYGVSREARKVTRADEAAYRALFERALADSVLRREYLSMLGHPSQPGFLPAYSRILVAEDGKVWAQVYAPDLLAPAVWDVFAADREWLGQVRTPAGFSVEAIAGDELVGVWRDELLVEYVRVYRLVTSG